MRLRALARAPRVHGTACVHKRIPISGYLQSIQSAFLIVATCALVAADTSGSYVVDVSKQHQVWVWVWVCLQLISFLAKAGGDFEFESRAHATVRQDTHSHVHRLTTTPQVILGIGYEIQSDSIGSGNNGLPAANTSVPNDLVPSERTRFFKDMLQGFRFCRLAMGLCVLRSLTHAWCWSSAVHCGMLILAPACACVAPRPPPLPQTHPPMHPHKHPHTHPHAVSHTCTLANLPPSSSWQVLPGPNR